MLENYAIHFGLELVGQLVLYLSYRHLCSHTWHRVSIWFLGTLLTSVITVHLVG